MKITLCGSTRYKENFEKMNRELSKKGHIVYSVSCYGHSGDVLTDEEKEMLDLVHLKKIMESDAIMVVGQDDQGKIYIGDSTRREIRWAKMLGKGVYFEANADNTLSQFYHVDMVYPVIPDKIEL